MKKPGIWMVYVAIAFIVAGTVGLVATNLAVNYSTRVRLASDRSLLGQAIYIYGVDAQGPIPIRAGAPSVRMMGGGCATCHGLQGEGGLVMMTGLEAPPISYNTLTSGLYEEGGRPYNPADIERAVTQGIDANGELLNAAMPRWQLRDKDWPALQEYLKYLDRFGAP